MCDSLIKKFKECPGDGMADITDLKSVGVIRAGSSPALGTIL